MNNKWRINAKGLDNVDVLFTLGNGNIGIQASIKGHKTHMYRAGNYEDVKGMDCIKELDSPFDINSTKYKITSQILDMREGVLYEKYESKTKPKVKFNSITFVSAVNSVYLGIKVEYKESNSNIWQTQSNSPDFYVHYYDHIKKFKGYWDTISENIPLANITDQRVLLSLYHLIIAGNTFNTTSIGARGLTSYGYKGHIFWDTEIFMLPFYTDNFPNIAKNMLIYRYNCLNEAKKKAKKFGYKGAMFAWESAKTGKEETPKECNTSIYEQHITADIAFAVVEYYKKTNDVEFMEKYGNELLREINKFWLSRIDNKRGILGVTGADEYHVNIDNNAFTNYMVASSINEYNFNGKSIASTISNIYNNYNIVEQYNNYFKKPTKIKQADVLMIFLLFPQYFSDKIMLANYNYYEPKTDHSSSLSAGVHAILAKRLDLKEDTKKYFNRMLDTDLKNIYNNTHEGIHMANCGLVYQYYKEAK